MSDDLTTAQAGALLGLAPGTVRRYCELGKLAGVKAAPDYPWRIARTEVERFVRERQGVGYPKGRPRTRPADAAPGG
jgi:predicted site-specific integrase-resolvase